MKQVTRTVKTVMLVPETKEDRLQLHRRYPRHHQLGLHGVVVLTETDEQVREVPAFERARVLTCITLAEK